MDPRVLAAARNNASWCDLVCKSHDLPTVLTDQLWVAPDGSPPRYPDAVTLLPSLAPDVVLADIGVRDGCSVKDSFADLELRDHGFVELFEARWMFREPASPELRPRLRWTVLKTEDELNRWSAAAGAEGTFRPVLLRNPAVALLVAQDGQGSGGAIVNRTGSMLGVSNVFAAGTDLEAIWADVPAAVGQIFGQLPLVGYERAEPLAFAKASGFEPMAPPVRVWLKPAD